MLDVRSTGVEGLFPEKVQHMFSVLAGRVLRSHRRRARRMHVAYVAAFRHVRRAYWWFGHGCTGAHGCWWSVRFSSLSSSSLSLFAPLSFSLSLSFLPLLCLVLLFASMFVYVLVTFAANGPWLVLFLTMFAYVR